MYNFILLFPPPPPPAAMCWNFWSDFAPVQIFPATAWSTPKSEPLCNTTVATAEQPAGIIALVPLYS